MSDSTRAAPAVDPEQSRVGAISNDDILWAVSRRAFDAGRQYWATGSVLDVRATPDGTAIESRVQGSERRPYSQFISLQRSSAGKLAISGDCSCPVGHNCKHVAAALIAFQHQARPELPLAAPPRSEPAPAASASVPIPPEVDAWLRRLDEAQTPETEEYPPTVRKRLLYVLDQRDMPAGIIVALTSIDIKRDGGASAARGQYAIHQLMQTGQQQPKFLRPSDRRILRQLSGMGAEDAEFIAVLTAMAETGRARWGAWDGPALSVSGPVAGTLGWAVADDGRQRPVLQVPGPLVALRLAAPWYVDPTTGAIGPVEIEQPPEVIRVMLAAPWLAPAAAARVRDEMALRWPGRRLPTPRCSPHPNSYAYRCSRACDCSPAR